MGRLEDLLLVEAAGELSPELQGDLDLLREAGEVPPRDEEPGFLRKAGALGLRVGGPILGGAAGFALGGPAGAIAGGAAGGAAGEAAAEALLGEDLRPLGIVAGAATGAIPAGPFARAGAKAVGIGAKAALGAAEGATQGILGSTVQTGLEEGRLPTLGEAAVSTLGGAALGGALGPLTKGAPDAPRPLQPQDVDDVSDDIVTAFAKKGDETFPKKAGAAEPTTPTQSLRPERAGEADEFVDRAFADQPEDARDLIKKVYSNNPDLVEEHTRGQVPFARTQEDAAALAFDPEDVVPGMNPNAEQTLAARNLVAALSEKAAKIGGDLRVMPGDPALTADLTRAHEDLVDAALAVRGFRAEQGRALNALKIKAQAAAGAMPGDPGDPTVRFIEAANRYGAKRDDIVAAIARAGDDPIRRMRELINIARPDAASTLRGLYVTNLLTGPKTFERNIVGNALRVLEDIALKPVSAAVDVIGSAAKGRAREVRLGEAPVAALAAVKSIPSASRAAFQILRQGFTDEAAHRMAFDEGKFDIPQEFGGVLRPLNIVGRSLNATDIFFKNIAASVTRDSASYAEAYKRAAGEGLRGGALKKRTADLMAEISTNPPKAILAEIEEASARSVFREGSLFAQKLDATINAMPLPLRAAARITMPFIRTPANIISQGFQHTPAGFVTKKGREVGRLGTQERARAALGTLLLYPLVDAAANGNLTGSASHTDAGKRDAFLAEHPENSIRVGDTWYQYSDLGPLAIPMTLVANAVQEWQASGKDLSEEDVTGLTTRVGRAMANAGSTLFDASYLSGVGEFLDALQNPNQNGPKFIQRRLSSFVPGQGLLRAAAQVESPVVRQPKGLEEAVKANLPGLQKQVLPRIDAFGEVVERGDKGARALFIPTTKPAASDPMRQELNRLGVEVEPAKPTGEVAINKKHKVAIDRNSDFALRQAKGLTARFMLQRLMESPGYARANDDLREEVIRKTLKRAGTFVKERAAAAIRRDGRLTTEALVPPALLQEQEG